MTTGRRRFGTMAALSACAILIGIFLQLRTAAAETVEVAPGVKVTKKSFSAPPSEQPFFGFVDKTPALREVDATFVASLVKVFGTREKAFADASNRGWRAIDAGNSPEAAKRFNQAFLLAPERSEIYHGFAIVVADRFRDPAFADELFQIARKQPAPLPTVNADYGRFLLNEKRPRDAEPVLEQAVKDTPRFGNAWSNLGVARLQNGNPSGACLAADQADKFQNAANVNMDVAWIKRKAQCSD
jgi:predicted Zn-dependent protease